MCITWHLCVLQLLAIKLYDVSNVYQGDDDAVVKIGVHPQRVKALDAGDVDGRHLIDSNATSNDSEGTVLGVFGKK